MANSVFLPKDIDLSKIRYTEVKTLENQSKIVGIFYGSSRLTIQVPLMSMPYGINDYNDKDGKVAAFKKYDVNVSFRGIDETPKIKALHDLMVNMEKKITKDAFENRLAWFKDNFDDEPRIVAKLFTPIIKIDKDKDTGKPLNRYPPTMKVKLPYDNATEAFTFEAHDMAKTVMDFKANMSKLKGAKAQLIIQLTGIWFAGGKYGVTWKVIMGKFQKANLSKYEYVDDSDDEDVSKQVDSDDDELAEEARLEAAALAASALAAKLSTVVDDSEEEEVVASVHVDEEEDSEVESEEEEDDEPTPPPPPPKKAASTKKAKK